jgi:HD-like signal output (HDOD) protein
LKLEDPNTTAADISEIIEKDPAMSAKTLQIVNSAYFALSRNITSVREAVALLGFRTIKNLVLAAEVFRSFSDYGQGLGLWIEGMQAHSLLTARIASGMFSDRKMADDAFMAAVLHDTGKLVLATQKPKYLKELMVRMRAENCPMHVAEQAEAGITHAEIGGYLLGLWGLPYPIVEAVALHHSPRNVEQLRFDLLAAVHIADLLANEAVQGRNADEDIETIELEYLAALGVLDRLPEWRAIAAREAESKVGRG